MKREVMSIIDADCHVIECERTWEFFDEREVRYKPLILTRANEEGGADRYLSIDGRVRAFGRKDDASRRELLSGFAQTTEATRSLLDVPARLRHMDELGIDIQVLYPTTMALSQVTPRPEVDVALSRSYNRWMADACGRSGGRLRWIAVPGVLNLDAALSEVRWAVDHGACGVLLRPFEGDRLLCDPYFFPLYAQAQALNVPIAIHDGNANPAFSKLVAGEAFSGSKLPILSAIHALICHGVPDRFPTLRWGFIEAAASWLPWVVTDLQRRLERTAPELQKENFLRDNRMYVTCQTNEDIPYITHYVGEDNLVMGTDYGHSDTSSELEALKNLQRDSDLPSALVHKILEDNPKALYGL
jgi:uncharacterized protein